MNTDRGIFLRDIIFQETKPIYRVIIYVYSNQKKLSKFLLFYYLYIFYIILYTNNPISALDGNKSDVVIGTLT